MPRPLDPDELYDTALERSTTISAVRHSLRRADAYDASQTASRAYLNALDTGLTGPELDRLRQASTDAHAEYMAWKNADTLAAIAGALD